MDLIYLQSGELAATINPQGGWLETWKAGDTDLLFPKQSFTLEDGSQKVRGGCHVCLPNFGPDKSGVLPQHGFARDSLWKVLSQVDSSVVLGLSMAEGAYNGLVAKLTYSLEPHALRMRLDLNNEGQRELLVAPGFHPYFQVTERVVRINGQHHKTESFAEPQVAHEDSVYLQTGTVSYKLTTTNLSAWVTWSDGLGEYVCTEPTQSAFSFNETTPQVPAERLVPGAKWDCEFDINVSM